MTYILGAILIWLLAAALIGGGGMALMAESMSDAPGATLGKAPWLAIVAGLALLVLMVLGA